jgi:hypothetical protein
VTANTACNSSLRIASISPLTVSIAVVIAPIAVKDVTDVRASADEVAAVAANAVWAVGYYSSGLPYTTLTLHWNGSA